MDETLKVILDKLNALEEGQQAIQAEIVDLRGELKLEITDLRGELKQEIADLRTEMQEGQTGLKQEIADLRTEMNEGFDRLEDSINMAAQDAAITERRLKEHIIDSQTA